MHFTKIRGGERKRNLSAYIYVSVLTKMLVLTNTYTQTHIWMNIQIREDFSDQLSSRLTDCFGEINRSKVQWFCWLQHQPCTKYLLIHIIQKPQANFIIHKFWNKPHGILSLFSWWFAGCRHPGIRPLQHLWEIHVLRCLEGIWMKNKRLTPTFYRIQLCFLS